MKLSAQNIIVQHLRHNNRNTFSCYIILTWGFMRKVPYFLGKVGAGENASQGLLCVRLSGNINIDDKIRFTHNGLLFQGGV